MARRVALDTGVLAGIERRVLDRRAILAPSDDVGLPVVVLAEYRVGLELAGPEHRARMEGLLRRLTSTATVIPYDEMIMEEHVRLLAWTHRHGCPRGQHDLIIAATCLATDRVLLTTDRKARFEDLPGLRVRLLG